ncbi:MAG: class I SAM-dependent methyltransferase [Arenimonas sp.]
MRSAPLLGAIALCFTLIACHRDPKPDADNVAIAPTGIEAQVAALQGGNWRDAANVARDRYRHPAQTLAFFGVTPDMTVLEVWPGGGWYTELLGPYLQARGQYVAIANDPAAATTDRNRDSWTEQNARLQAKVGARADVYGAPRIALIDPKSPVLGDPGSADAVLTFRNAHNWVMAGTEADMFEAFYEVLKPGGVLGVVDHRARAGAAEAEMKTSGYLPEQAVIAMAIRAGFVLEARSEINANPNDTADYPEGVWTLPPRLTLGDVDRDRYLAIGESDRMTLRFRKPRE